MTNRTLLTGGTGTLGTALRPGYETRATTFARRVDRRRQIATTTSTGSRWTWPRERGSARRRRRRHRRPHGDCAAGDTEAVDVRGTERLLEAAADADVSNVVYVSIVGVDEIPYSYYEQKHAVEQTVAESDIPSTIVRATQFHSFVADLLETASRLPVWPLPTGIRLQPIDVGEVADAIVDHATLDAAGRVPISAVPRCELSATSRGPTATREGSADRSFASRFPGRPPPLFRAGGAICRTGPSER